MNDSPNSLNRKILDFFKQKNLLGGFFIEAGAANGIWQSNSILLEKELFWNGLLVEPNKIMYEECLKNRPNCLVENVALVDNSFDKKTVQLFTSDHDYGLCLSGKINYKNDENLSQKDVEFDLKKGAKWVTVATDTLSNILEKNNIKRKIDFFSLDVEGVELIVLEGLNLAINRPRYILLELSNDHKKELSIEYLKNKNYTLIEKMTTNDFLFRENMRME
jgi:FkbM family methyltransferase